MNSTETIDINYIDAKEWVNGSAAGTLTLDGAARELVSIGEGWLDGFYDDIEDEDGNTDYLARDLVIAWLADLVADYIRTLADVGKEWGTLDELADEMNAFRTPAEIPASVLA
jgi:hypothetical protein